MRALILLSIAFVMISQIPIFSMDQSVKDKMEIEWHKFNVWRNKHNKKCPICDSARGIRGSFIDMHCFEREERDQNLRNVQNSIILNAGNLVSDQEKLDKLYGDDVYFARKNIIKKMIQDGINPTNIRYQYNKTPLKEAILFKDNEFEQFLIQHGALL